VRAVFIFFMAGTNSVPVLGVMGIKYIFLGNKVLKNPTF
jgi:hypothetical protein